jgi:glycosyltransferase involved in cell wall biosynthesis
MFCPEISIIIPVYNTEHYLPRCIDSVISQTFSDYECIIVDDGSTDLSSQICDEYARKDTRIRVIHKENGGLSSARNTGIDNSNGNYIFFLDSDDFVPSEALDKLNTSIGNAEICSGKYSSFLKNVPFAGNARPAIKRYTKKLAMKNILLLRAPYTFLWGKLYKRELFNGLRHADGLYEDVDLTYKIIDRCTEIRCVNTVCYFYNLGNTDSITASRYTHSHFAGVENAQKMMDFVMKTYLEYGWAAKYYFCQMNFHIYKRMLISPDVPIPDRNIVRKNIRRYMLFTLCDLRNIFKSLVKIFLFLSGDTVSLYFYRLLAK